MFFRGSRQWKPVGKTERIENTNDPEWATTFVMEYYFEEKQVWRIIKMWLFGERWHVCTCAKNRVFDMPGPGNSIRLEILVCF